MVKVLIKKLNPSVKLPSYKTNGASGMDLMAFIKKPINLQPGKSVLFRLGYQLLFQKIMKFKLDQDLD